MNIQERVYSVLVVSASGAFFAALSPLLPESKYQPIVTVSNISAAKRTLAERSYDFVIVNSPLPDDTGIRFAADACAARGTVVLLFARADVHAETYHKVAEYGVFTLPKPTSQQTIAQALCWMASTRERLRQFEKKTLSIEEKMEEIRLVNRAKWLLIRELKMDEPNAHRYIEKQAMDRCVSRKTVAQELIKVYT